MWSSNQECGSQIPHSQCICSEDGTVCHLSIVRPAGRCSGKGKQKPCAFLKTLGVGLFLMAGSAPSFASNFLVA